MAAIVIIFVGSVCLSVCAFSRWREALGETYAEKCLFFIRQMETDATESEGKFVGPERKWGRGGVLPCLPFSLSLHLSHDFLASAAERQLTKSVEQLMQ